MVTQKVKNIVTIKGHKNEIRNLIINNILKNDIKIKRKKNKKKYLSINGRKKLLKEDITNEQVIKAIDLFAKKYSAVLVKNPSLISNKSLDPNTLHIYQLINNLQGQIFANKQPNISQKDPNKVIEEISKKHVEKEKKSNPPNTPKTNNNNVPYTPARGDKYDTLVEKLQQSGKINQRQAQLLDYVNKLVDSETQNKKYKGNKLRHVLSNAILNGDVEIMNKIEDIKNDLHESARAKNDLPRVFVDYAKDKNIPKDSINGKNYLGQPQQDPDQSQYFNVDDDYEPIDDDDDKQDGNGNLPIERYDDVFQDGLENWQIKKLASFYKIKDFLGVFDVTLQGLELPDVDRVCWIMNTKVSPLSGHWVSVILSKPSDGKVGVFEYFDSFGEFPSNDILNSIAKVIKNSSFAPYFYQNKINLVQFQSDLSKNCGWFALSFLYDRLRRKKTFKQATRFDLLEKAHIKCLNKSEIGEKDIEEFKEMYSPDFENKKF